MFRWRSLAPPSLGALLLLASALALAAASPVAAKPTAGQACQASQLRAFSRFMKADFKCWSGFLKRPDADPDGTRLRGCLAKAADQLTASYLDGLDTAGPGVCGLEEPVVELVDVLQLTVDGLVVAISADYQGTDKAERSLHASLQKATGAALASALGAESKHAKKADESKRQSARSRARAKLLSAFAKAEAKAGGDGVPYTGLPADVLADEVDRIADALAALTLPAGSTFSVGGTIQAAEGSLVDSDVNDPNMPPIPNDTPGTAQGIPVPAAVGGYVNLAGAGPDGNSRALGDPSDFFRVSLEAGQRVNLRFGDPLTADLDLCLYGSSDPSTALDCSLGVSETEELTVPSSGQFYVEVFAFPGCACGASYILTLGQVLPASGPNGVRLSDEFRPGEVVVTLAAKALAAAASTAPLAEEHASRFGMQALGGAADREMLFRIPTEALARTSSFQALELDAERSSLHTRFRGLSGPQREKLDTLLAVKALQRRADVAVAEPNFVRRALATPNDPFFALQWHYPLINLPAAWDLTTGSASVEVAVIDTGALFGHPDLQGQLAPGFDFISNPSTALDGTGIDPNAEDPGDGGGFQRSSFHGTHVAGTIGAATNNGSGVSGVAWAVTLVPLRVLGLGGGTSYDVRQAVRYAAGLANDSGTSNKVDIINLSLGGGGFSGLDQTAYNEARNAGVIVIAAAGNDNSSQLFYPASYDGVVSVSAVDLRSAKAPYSNFGTAVDVAAPGGDTSVDRNGDGYADGVLSTLADEFSGLFGFTFYDGTSMASPHMAGVAALMKAVKPALTPAELDTLLASGAITTDLGAPGRDDVFGHGLIDARRAVEAASASSPGGPILLVGPTGLNLGTSQTQASFQVTNGGGGTLSLTSVTDDQPWLSIVTDSVDANGLGTYRVTVDRTGLANGTYSGSVSVQSPAGSASVSVVMAVVSASIGANAGFHYVLLVDPETFDVVAQFDVGASGGQYAYALANVPAGSFLLFAGSDADNDFSICGTGEACGAFPTLGSPEIVEVASDRSNLDFVTGFLQSIEASAANAGFDPTRIRRSPSRRRR